jgi:hypothetical protein
MARLCSNSARLKSARGVPAEVAGMRDRSRDGVIRQKRHPNSSTQPEAPPMKAKVVRVVFSSVAELSLFFIVAAALCVGLLSVR